MMREISVETKNKRGCYDCIYLIHEPEDYRFGRYIPAHDYCPHDRCPYQELYGYDSYEEYLKSIQ